MHQAYHCVKIIIDVNSYFHVVQSVHKTWNNPRVLIHLSAIALHLNTTTTGSGVEEDYTETNGTPGRVIDFPVRIAVSLYNAASGLLAYATTGTSSRLAAHLRLQMRHTRLGLD